MNTQENRPEIENDRLRRDPAFSSNAQTVSTTPTDDRQYAPLRSALPSEVPNYEWRRETGEIQSYQHRDQGSWIHLDPQGQFYNRHAEPISRDVALSQNQPSQKIVNAQSVSSGSRHSIANDQGISF